MHKEHSTCIPDASPETALMLVDMLRYFTVGFFPSSEMEIETAMLREIAFMNILTPDIFKKMTLYDFFLRFTVNPFTSVYSIFH